MRPLVNVVFLLVGWATTARSRVQPAGEVASVPPRGWSSWTQFRCNLNETLIREIADAMVVTGLVHASYDLLWLDDCWGSCDADSPDGSHCLAPTPRDSQHRIVASEKKFPSGMKALVDYVHLRGLRIGIYTAVSSRTCAGYHGSLLHEEIDADTFVNLWGFDAVKHDTCNTDCGIHTGCMQNSTWAMWTALEKVTERPVLYYVDSGNPTSAQRVYNPHNIHVKEKESLTKLATSWTELAWIWLRAREADAFKLIPAGPHAHMIKLWFDRDDSWGSMLDNVHAQVHLQEFQQCGAFLMPDYLTIGMGGLNRLQYMAEIALWAVLGAPLFLSCDVRFMDSFTRELVMNPEMLAINGDPACIQGSQAQTTEATEVWIKPLSDASFAVAAINKGQQAANVTVQFTHWGDFFPAEFEAATVRDVLARSSLGTLARSLTLAVPPLSGRLVRIAPVVDEAAQSQEVRQALEAREVREVQEVQEVSSWI